jgi:5-methylcytosine-specific restriction protein A
MTPRKHISTRERARLFLLHEGLCHICGNKIDGVRERWDVEHVIPFALTQDDSDENRKPAHYACHKPKTKDDVRMIRKSDRVRAKHIGAKAPTRRPLPGSRNSPFKIKLDGTIVPR